MIDQPQFDRQRTGSLYDRGAADSFYRRPRDPHWWLRVRRFRRATTVKKIIELTEEEIFEYHLGYSQNDTFKEY